ncbi:cytochrome C assembly family protein [Gracilibacillus salinarum]|uniref:Cytochrome c biogenesis protein n=1 Tax=Gracilibacillus salinarum TaxID=2932255 RepID=A0ABY4GQE2_9BACI|nr:cytochrome c biogenesis protein CcsA [Gracilibacillus salinarum]UOQ86180.1 cytochrome c biogenesis protein [Gracilibacillus salinarum]
MLAERIIHECMLMLYGLSVIFYFIDFLYQNRKANHIAFWLLSVVWILQTIFLLTEIWQNSSLPIQTLHDGLYTYTWIIITFSLVVHRFFQLEFFMFFMSVFGFFFMIVHTLQSVRLTDSNQIPMVLNEMLFAHIVLALLSYGLFTISFILACLYFMQYQLLKRKIGYKWLRRFQDLEGLEKRAFHLIVLAEPMLILSIILGVVWAYMTGTEFYWGDSKTIGSILVFAIYAGYLYIRIKQGYRGKKILTWNVIAFLILLINFFLFNSLSNFHM